MRLQMKDFSFFNSDEKAMVAKMKAMIDMGNCLELEMTRSTSLNEAMCIIAIHFSSHSKYEYHISVDRNDKYYDKLLVVTIYKKVEETK